MRVAFLVLLRPLIWVVLGLSAGGREHLPRVGPAIVAANHNSHLDVLALLATMPISALAKVRPVAAADYFGGPGLRRLIALRLLNGIALERVPTRGSDPFAVPLQALSEGDILIIFPEGTRGRPEEMGTIKAGLTKLAKESGAAVTPVYMQGVGRMLPKGTYVPLPFLTTVLAGAPIAAAQDRQDMKRAVEAAFEALKQQAPPLHWH